jgi:16S rRNA (cytosine967-C5)-methyltransferase
MKLFPNLVKAIVNALEEIFIKGAYADDVVEHTLKKDSRWGARDRKFIASYIYEIVRWYRLFESCLNENQKTNNLNYSLFAVAHINKGYTLPLWKEFSDIDVEQVQKKLLESIRVRKLKNSIPDWLDDLGVTQFGESTWEKEIAYLNQEAEVYIRANSLKTTPLQLQNILSNEGVEVAPIESAIFKNEKPLVLIKRQRLQTLKSYQNGLFEIQDAASQLVAPFMQIKPGMKVIDACAGAGGKTLHIACLMQNKGSIVAMDKEPKKLLELERRASKAGVSIINTAVISLKVIENNKATADRLLLDVPCSGLGVLRRNPDAKWKLNLNFIDEILQVQAQILDNYSEMLKSGGIMVYATCSILPLENQNQIKRFLLQHKGIYELVAEQSILPSQGYDGFYMACLKKH